MDYSARYKTYYYTATNPLFYGTGETGAKVTLKVNGITHSTQPTINSNSEWSIGDYTFSTGTHTVQFTASDTAGNQTMIAFTLIIDPTTNLFPQSIVNLLTNQTPTPSATEVPTLAPTASAEAATSQATPTPQGTPEGGTPSIRGNTLTVRVINRKPHPIKGLTLHLAPNPQTTITNENGEATFKKVLPGEHTLSFQYKGKEIEKTLNLLSDEQHLKVDVTVNESPMNRSYFGLPWWVIIPILGLVLTLSIVVTRLRTPLLDS